MTTVNCVPFSRSSAVPDARAPFNGVSCAWNSAAGAGCAVAAAAIAIAAPTATITTMNPRTNRRLLTMQDIPRAAPMRSVAHAR
jgi:hypothetical protein